MNYEAVESRYVAGQPWVGSFQADFAGPDSVMGGLAGYNPLSNKVAWYNKEYFSVWSGVLTTASNLVFYGTLDRWFKAVDAKKGQELWKFQVGSGVIGNAFTYHQKGKQYIGVVTGVGSLPGNTVIQETKLRNTPCGICDYGMGGSGGFYQLTHSNAIPSGGAINVFSL